MGTIRLAHYQVPNRYGAGKTPCSVRFAVLADLHNNVYRSDVSRLIRAVKKEKCDAVLSAGDLVLMKHGHFETDQALRLVCTLAGMMPVYISNGNHEARMERLYGEQYRSYEQVMEKAGVIRLHNSSVEAVINGMEFAITGLELDRRYFRNRYHKDLYVPEIRKRVGKRRKDRFQILLAHHPKYFPVYAQWGADLTLSGHLHGGIVRLPVLGGVISPDPELLPHYDHGLYQEGGAKMIVSAGLGSHSVNLRINNPAELVIVDVQA